MRDLVYVVQMVVGPRTGSTNPSGEGPDSGNGTCGIVDHDSPPRMFLLLILEEALSSEAIKMWTSTWKAWYLGNLKNLGFENRYPKCTRNKRVSENSGIQ